MYQHLLVPIDETELSIETVGNAVGLARTLGARITFFHASADLAGSLRGEADVLRLTAPADLDWALGGQARELLCKAEAAARALGVPCDLLQAAHDHPAQAIVAAARQQGCDLIFMASHGARSKLGMALSSATLEVLMHAGLPVLVAATGEPPPPARAIAVIRDEHRSLAAVLHAGGRALAEARAAGRLPALALLRDLVHYLRVFPLALHHPKEDAHLFSRLRERAPALASELDELQRQHLRDHALVDALAGQVEALATAMAVGDGLAARTALQDLDASFERYVRFTWEHLGREEGVILPAAQRHLLAQDWAAIDAAFAEHREPRAAVAGAAAGEGERALRQLFSRIVGPRG
ncbi:universal stress protein [Aquabacterium sp.]|uniref:universal stress protein n=1 Tax=Aquabacterium sp. TaxID=1872578 RepID=UPI0037852C5C